MRRASPLLALAAIGSFGLFAPAHAGSLDMDSLWPNEDGRSWTYAQRTEQYVPAPTSSDRVLRMFLDGTALAPDGIPVQMLRGQLVSGFVSADAHESLIADPMLRAIHRARPDLRGAIEAGIEGTGCEVNRIGGFDAVLLSAELTFQKTASEIVSWRCNTPDLRAWRWLVADLSIGNTFTLPLVPDLADNIMLHGTIAAVEDVVVPAGAFAACLRVDYRIDYGTTECTDPGGSPIGTTRGETRGSMHYAMGIGPVATEEAFYPAVEGTGDCSTEVPIGEAAARVTMKLQSLPVDVVPVTWGQIKSRYR